MPRIITIAREYGSGGRLIAQKLRRKSDLYTMIMKSSTWQLAKWEWMLMQSVK